MVLQPIGLGDKTYSQILKEKVELELAEGHSYEEIIIYHNTWDWEKFTSEGEF
jgi:hypothetical protein